MKKLFLVFSLVLSMFISGVVVNASTNGEVSISSKLNGEVQAEGLKSTPKIGSVLDLNATGFEGKFAFWTINGFLRTDISKVEQIRVQSKMDIVGHFHSEDRHAVFFVDSNGKLIDDVYVADGGTAPAPSYAGYTKPEMTVNTATPWATLEGVTSLENITSSRVYVLQYTINASPVTISVIGGTASSIEVNQNDVVTVIASNPGSFTHWVDGDGKVLSYNSTFVFTAVSNMTVKAKSDVVTPESMVTITDVSGIRSDKESYVGRFELQGTAEVVEFGFLLSETQTGEITFDTAGVIVAKSNTYNQETNEFLMSFNYVTYLSVRAYMVVDNGTTIETVYSAVEGSFASDLFISEYIEGSSNNKAIEIFNGTGSPVDLSSYNLKIYVNGATPGSAIDLSGTLNPGEVYVVANPSANATILDKDNMTSESLSHNGNDAVGLFKGTTLVDIFGKPGDSSNYAKDTTRVRNKFVSQPSIEWKTEEWDVYPKDTSSYLGSHTMDGASVTLTDSQSILLDANDLSLVSEVKEATTLDLPSNGSNGTTITWSSDTPLIITNGGVVTLPEGQPVTVIMTATVSKGSLSKDVTFEVTVGKTDAEKLAEDKDALDIATTITEAGDMGLPLVGSVYSSTITWSSNDTDIVTNSGIVTLPASGSVEVTLTATIDQNGTEDTKGFVITVFAETEQEVITVTASYAGSTTINMVAGNNANSVGLDPSIFSVTAEKGAHNLYPGLNKDGQIRLYNSKPAGNGNELSVTVLNGYTIKSVTIVFGNKVAKTLIKTGDVQAFSGDLNTNETKSFTDLSVDTISIKNIGSGQLYVMSIVITYVVK